MNSGDTIQFFDRESYERARTFVDGKMVCDNCKHWLKEYKHLAESCSNIDIIDMIDTDYGGGFSFDPPANFGCNKWEAK
jgi:hypothetical protein